MTLNTSPIHLSVVSGLRQRIRKTEVLFFLSSSLLFLFLSVIVRGKINAAVSLPLDDIPENDALTSLLAIPHLNYFHVGQIVEVLSSTVGNISHL